VRDVLKTWGGVVLSLGLVSQTFADGGVGCVLETYLDQVDFGTAVPGDFEARDMVVRDGIAYVAADESGLQIFDVSDPTNLTRLSQLSLGGVAQGIDLFVGEFATLAFIACDDAGVRIVRVTDPSNPEFTFISTLSLNDARDVAVLPSQLPGQIILGVAAGSEGYRAYDLTTVFPSQIEFEFGSDVARSIEVQESGGEVYIYVAVGTAGVDVYTPGASGTNDLVTTLSTPGTAYECEAVGDVLYVADGSSGVEAIELLPDRSGGSIEDNVPISFARSLTLEDDRLYVTNTQSLVSIIDTSDPTSPDVVGTIRSLGDAVCVGASGTDVFLGTRDSGVVSVDMSDPAAQVSSAELGSYEWTDGNISNPHRTKVVGDMAYVPRAILEIFDVSTGVPVLTGSFDSGATIIDVDVVGTIAYAVDRQALSIIDVSDPSSPVLLGSVTTPGTALHVLVDEGKAYIADRSNGMQIVDVSDPTSPTIIGTFATGSDAKEILYVGDSVFMRLAHILTDDKVEVVSLLEETTPVALGPGIAIDGSVLYGAVSDGTRLDQINYDIAEERYQLRSIDVTNPLLPSVITQTGAVGYLTDLIQSGDDPMLERSGDILSISTSESGVVMFDLSDPSVIRFLGVFNESDDYAMSWTIDSGRGYLRIPGKFRIYDMSACTPVCAVDLNGDTNADFFDLTLFLSGMLDWDGNTVFDFFDVSSFLQAFSAGCP